MTYSESYFTARETWRDWRIETRQMIDLARVSKGTRVLEIGCGAGGLLRLLSGRGAGVVGVDTSPVALELAQRRDAPSGRLCEVIRIGVEDVLPFRDGSFDVIVGQHVLEHLTDISAALCEWKRLLKPGGRLALATPNSRYPDPRHFADPNHTQVLSLSELSAAVDRAGFAVQAAYTIFPFLSRNRVLRGLGVIGYRVFLHAPYFSAHGRTIILGASKPGP